MLELHFNQWFLNLYIPFNAAYKRLTFLIKTDNKNKLKNCKNLFFTFSNTPIKSFWTVLLPCVDPINRGTQPLQFVSDGNGESFSSQQLILNKRALVDIARWASFGSVSVSALFIEKATAFNILFLQRTCEVMLLYKGILTERRKILIDFGAFLYRSLFSVIWEK